MDLDNNKMPPLEPCNDPQSSKLDDQARNLDDNEFEIQCTNAINLMKKFLSSTPNVKTAFKPRGSNIHQLSPLYEFQDLREMPKKNERHNFCLVIEHNDSLQKMVHLHYKHLHQNIDDQLSSFSSSF